MLQLVVPALAVIGIVVIGTKIFENASKREKEKQRDFNSSILISPFFKI